ncbi:MAG: nucleotidyltransferase family protein [Calditrichaeota bacterium]|nr:MAG: nucleotidyltransferase family protein [Calditrichota bacterium]
MIEAVILAAGQSRRMGELKPLIRIREKTILRLITDVIVQSGVEAVHVIVGFQADTIMRESGVSAQFHINADYELGQFSSLQIGIRSLSGLCKAALVCLADQPHIQSEWIKNLISQFRSKSAPLYRLRFDGRCGHPLLINSSIFPEILALDQHATMKTIMARYEQEAVYIDTPSEGILLDADTPEQLQRIRELYFNHPSVSS